MTKGVACTRSAQLSKILPSITLRFVKIFHIVKRARMALRLIAVLLTGALLIGIAFPLLSRTVGAGF